MTLSFGTLPQAGGKWAFTALNRHGPARWNSNLRYQFAGTFCLEKARSPAFQDIMDPSSYAFVSAAPTRNSAAHELAQDRR